MTHGDVIIRFDEVTFIYNDTKQTLDAASFSVRENAKVIIMGQNGAGKSTIFKLITEELKPTKGRISTGIGKTIATAHQVMARENLELTVEQFFATAFSKTSHPESKKIYDLPKKIKNVLEVVHLTAPLDKQINKFSGGQQARLLLAYAIIQEPDILLLDEPTNNLDAEGISHLTQFLMDYPKTVLVISHDANFLNAFTDGVLYLDSFTHKVDQYQGNYFDVQSEIEAQIERERAKNAQLQKSIQDRKDKINFFANKGGKMRKLASKLRDQVEEAEENMIDERQEDKTIRDFIIPAQENIVGAVAEIKSISVMINHEPVRKELPTNLLVRKKMRLLIEGPNGIGKSSFLRALANNTEPGAKINPDVKIGYYQQDFSGLDFNKTGYDSLAEMIYDRPDFASEQNRGSSTPPMGSRENQEIYATAAQFLLSSDILRNKVGALSEGQKGLLCYARFVLQKPGLLIMDEPTNHINFRHLPVIARALNEFAGAVILVSHSWEFIAEMTIDETLDLSKL